MNSWGNNDAKHLIMEKIIPFGDIVQYSRQCKSKFYIYWGNLYEFNRFDWNIIQILQKHKNNFLFIKNINNVFKNKKYWTIIVDNCNKEYVKFNSKIMINDYFLN
jgi:hypothetical protein